MATRQARTAREDRTRPRSKEGWTGRVGLKGEANMRESEGRKVNEERIVLWTCGKII